MNKLELSIGNRTITVQRGEIAKQAGGSAWVTCGETMVLVTACATDKPREGMDYFPLICDYREQTSAAGRFPGGFFKREGRPTEKETLVCRVIDRSIRPLFPAHYKNEVQVIAFVFSADPENDPDILAMIGASAALQSSNIPFQGPIGAVRIGMVDGQYVANPTISQLATSTINLVLAATAEAVIMLEGWAKEVSDEIFTGALEFGFEQAQKIIELQKPWLGEKKLEPEVREEAIDQAADDFLKERLPRAYDYQEKKARETYYAKIQEEFLATLPEDKQKLGKNTYERVFEDQLRRMMLATGRRMDSRGTKQIRPISGQTGLLPRTHGSALFTRGQTQCLSSITLGTSSDEQIIDGLLEESSKRFMLHYNFPPFSVGEVRMMRGPSRREIGHGALAERALVNMMPSEADFPYTVRIVANILESNGSSSMATVCASSLALMDAGIALPHHVGGVSVGLVVEDGKAMILTDIAGEEDHYGDMDLKIAGTIQGITAFQMDVKNPYITLDVLKRSVEQSHEGRMAILEAMNAVLPAPRGALSQYAPKIINIKIKPDKIGALIGPGGKNIRAIIERTGCKIDVEDDGSVKIASSDLEACNAALAEVRGLTDEAEVGKVYDGTVTRLMTFGAFVKIMPNQEGMIHISDLDYTRVEKVEDVLNVGDPVKVKVIAIDDQGRVNLSRKALLTPPPGYDPSQEKPRPPRRPSSGGRGGGRGGPPRRRF